MIFILHEEPLSLSLIHISYTVCKMMAEMTLNDIVSHVKEHGYITINDPACGAGATLIAAIHAAAKPLGKAGLNWQNHVLITAQDIDYTLSLIHI